MDDDAACCGGAGAVTGCPSDGCTLLCLGSVVLVGDPSVFSVSAVMYRCVLFVVRVSLMIWTQ